MNVSEFKKWFSELEANVSGLPTAEQWHLLRRNVSEIGDAAPVVTKSDEAFKPAPAASGKDAPAPSDKQPVPDVQAAPINPMNPATTKEPKV